MGALPKKKISRRRRDNRRSHIHLSPPQLISCPSCRQPIVAYQACPHCGMYRGRQVLPAAAAAR
ncbi:MAG: 50S ribosomal protein L32 [Chloroflexi bacterium]|nr:50S ribosomal protein L32 [Chloroflexota bacterium]